MLVLLDTEPLGLVTNPNASAQADAAAEWLESLIQAGVSTPVAELADYEVRRELLRARKQRSIARLDALVQRLGYVPLTTGAMRRAAEFWAMARQQGRPTADPAALDGDVILAAQAALLAELSGEAVVVATTNVAHVGRFVDARHWSNVAPPRGANGR